MKALRRVDNNPLMKQEGFLGAGREGREIKDNVCLGQENPTHQNEAIWMEGAYSLNLAKKRSNGQIQLP